jgi:hypothetical protein
LELIFCEHLNKSQGCVMLENNLNNPALISGEENFDLDKVINESKATLEAASAPKRGRGRPMGTTKVKPQLNLGNGAKAPPHAIKGEVIKINEIEPLAAEIIKAPFDLFGWKHNVDITPSDDEAKAPAKYLSKLIDAYLPDLESKDPKIFAMVALVISYALLALKKMRVFIHKKSNIPKDSKNEAPKDTDSNIQAKKENVIIPPETVSAGSVFGRFQ